MIVIVFLFITTYQQLKPKISLDSKLLNTVVTLIVTLFLTEIYIYPGSKIYALLEGPNIFSILNSRINCNGGTRHEEGIKSKVNEMRELLTGLINFICDNIGKKGKMVRNYITNKYQEIMLRIKNGEDPVKCFKIFIRKYYIPIIVAGLIFLMLKTKKGEQIRTAILAKIPQNISDYFQNLINKITGNEKIEKEEENQAVKEIFET